MPRQRSNQAPHRPDYPHSGEHLPFVPGAPNMSPGDEAPAGTPGTGENVCRSCGGKGRVNDRPCAECDGSGYVITGIGGG